MTLKVYGALLNLSLNFRLAIADHWATRNGEYVSAHMPDWKSPHAKNQQLARDLYAQSMDLVEKYL